MEVETMADEQQTSENQTPPTPETPTPSAPKSDAPPSGESPKKEPEPAFGWTSYAELINGRFAMIGFVALIVLEAITHQSFFEWLFN
jgi:hypothetical protein